MVYESFIKAKERGEKQFAILIDPDKVQNENLFKLIAQAQLAEVDYFFVGGSLMLKNNLENCIDILKSECDIPCVIFPGNARQLSRKADAILLLSLIYQH